MTPTLSCLPRHRVLAASALAVLLNLAGIPAALADTALVRVDVLDRDSGDRLRVWPDHGRPVVAGRPGARYAVRLANRTGERVLAVVAIDGVNVVSGETAGVGQRGYVLEPWQSTEITGWRKSETEVAAFEFTSLADSYAARTGRPLDVGVIGVALFREAPRQEVASPDCETRSPPGQRLGIPDAPVAAVPTPAPDTRRSAPAVVPPGADTRRSAETARADGGLAPPAAVERLGTGHGARETSVARNTSFERASAQPDQRVEIRYDSLDNLVAAGIVPPPRLAANVPHAFPADPPRDFVPDPPRR